MNNENFSNCCGVSMNEQAQLQEVCPECLEHCDIVTEDDIEDAYIHIPGDSTNDYIDL